MPGTHRVAARVSSSAVSQIRRPAARAWLTALTAALTLSTILSIAALGVTPKVAAPLGKERARAVAAAEASVRSGAEVGASVGPHARRDPPAATPLEPFAIGLYEDGDWVQQYTFEWCVAASVQMAWNMVHADRRTAPDDQQALWNRARDLSNNPYRGADPGGWADLLNEVGLGPYELVSIPDYDEALRVAARAMRDTSRPVGLVMWRGRHAWVMSGFESLGDPAKRDDFQVTGVRVVDPLYPYGSGTWGPSPEPNALLSTEQLATQFVFREQRRWSSHVPAGFLLVLPVTAALDPAETTEELKRTASAARAPRQLAIRIV